MVQAALDLITIGRSSVDLYGDQVGGRLEDMASFSKYIGGSPTNTAVGGARLGLRTGLITRVGHDHFGRFIREQLVREGVDVTGVKTDEGRLTALAVLGIRDQTQFPLIFYRTDCADMALCPDDIDESHVARARSVLVNGTHLSQPGPYAACLKAIEICRANGGRIIFDIDYRPVLWGLTTPDMGENRFVANAEVSAKLQTIIGLCDLIVGTEEEFHILGGTTDTLAALRQVRSGSTATLVCKRGADGCVVFEGPVGAHLSDGVSGPGFKVDVFNVLGAGDSFMSGFLRGWLRDLPIETCCQYGNACGALVVSRHGCAPAMPSWAELDYYLAQALPVEGPPPRLREDMALEHVHWATNRYPDYPELNVLAMDHRSQLLDIAESVGASAERIDQFKAFCLSAVDAVARGRPGFGLLLDGRFGMRGLEAAADYPYWIGRPIELPGSCPIEFEASDDVGATLREWPLNHVVKCLVFYHPDDSADLKARQERQILRLFDACRKTRHELLMEIIPSKNGPVGETTAAEVMQRFYDLGIFPDWWKLEPDQNPKTWAHVEAVIQANDPLCRGVVLLGLSAPDEALLASFESVAHIPIVKGFAVGRTIFQDAATQWLAGHIDDATAVQMLVERFAYLVDGWQAARAPACETSDA